MQIRTFINTGFHKDGSITTRQVLENIRLIERGERPTIRPYLFEEADTTSVFEPGPQLSLDLSNRTATDGQVLDMVWNIGNRMGLDANGLPWPRSTRSLSVGDVVQLQNGSYYAVQNIGWVELGEPPLVLVTSWGEHEPDIRRDGERSWSERVMDTPMFEEQYGG